MVGPKLNEFEKLESEMTKYYDNKDIREFHLLSKVNKKNPNKILN